MLSQNKVPDSHSPFMGAVIAHEDLLSVTISCVVQVKIKMEQLVLEHNSDSG